MCRPTLYIDPVVAPFVTNVAFKGRHVFMTESETGTILTAELPVAGKPMYGQS
jgi:hypothetical protein